MDGEECVKSPETRRARLWSCHQTVFSVYDQMIIYEYLLIIILSQLMIMMIWLEIPCVFLGNSNSICFPGWEVSNWIALPNVCVRGEEKVNYTITLPYNFYMISDQIVLGIRWVDVFTAGWVSMRRDYDITILKV